MQTHIDCFPCFLRQTVIAFRQRPGSHEHHRHILQKVLAIMQETDMARPPAYTTSFIHRAIREGLDADPFREVKGQYNDIALELYPSLRDMVRRSDDPLRTAVRLAIAGNVIDFGIYTAIDISGSVERALMKEIAVDDYEAFREDVLDAGTVLYLLDNAGEIVFDRLLIEVLLSMGRTVKAVVKGAPVLNDAVMADAVQAGLAPLCEVIDNGSDAIGTILPWTSPAFRDEFSSAELVISKGQANFETLAGVDKKTYFLFQSKCDVVSKELGLVPGSMLLKKSWAAP